MKPWETLRRGRRAFYLAAVLLPLVNIVMHLAVGGFSLYYLIPFTAALLLGLGNLALAARGRLPRKGLGLGLWHALLAVSLAIVVYLMQFQIGVIVWLASAD